MTPSSRCRVPWTIISDVPMTMACCASIRSFHRIRLATPVSSSIVTNITPCAGALTHQHQSRNHHAGPIR
ncbi:hypothetical protein GOB93_20555 [Acetobacter musti]|uniref:Uncharacterized protein n=1 Tax=Acetobacter musti TaxID=864732 RepID=A0ABX0JYQ9_9PROT|nr:hypothetical protein [Acetobacter musti]NHN86947.1 hypothetical protein [Acetobacter musti]